MIGVSNVCPLASSMLMFMTNSLPLLIYDVEFHKDPFLDLCYMCSVFWYVTSCNLFLYVDDTHLLFQHKDLEQIKEELTTNFSNICDSFVDNKLSICFGEYKTKSILFSTENRRKGKSKLWRYNMVTSKSSNTQK